MIVRHENPGDAEALGALVTGAFLTAAHASGTEAQILADLRSAGALTLSLVAEEAGTLLGQVAASPVHIGGAQGWAGIGPVAVAPGHQRRGIGAKLMASALAELRESGLKGAVLVGDPGYYGRFGFRAAEGLGVAGIPGEYVLALPFGAEPPRGEIRFHPAFGLE